MPTQKLLLVWSIVRIKKTKKKQYQHAHTKSVAARLVDSENWSKTFFFTKKRQYAHTKIVARLADSENWSKKKMYLQKNKIKTIRAHKKYC